jgi:hypothetical protein
MRFLRTIPDTYTRKPKPSPAGERRPLLVPFPVEILTRADVQVKAFELINLNNRSGQWSLDN